MEIILLLFAFTVGIGFIIRIPLFYHHARSSQIYRSIFIIAITCLTFLIGWMSTHYAGAISLAASARSTHLSPEITPGFPDNTEKQNLLVRQIWIRTMLPPLFMEYDCFVNDAEVCTIAWNTVERTDYYQPIYNYNLTLMWLFASLSGFIAWLVTKGARKQKLKNSASDLNWQHWH